MKNIFVQMLDHGCQEVTHDWAIACDTHILCRLYYIMNGSAIYTSNDETLTLDTGMLCLLPADIPYEVSLPQEGRCGLLWFDLNIFPFMEKEVIVLRPEPGSTLALLLDAAGRMNAQRLDSSEFAMICELIISQIDSVHPLCSIADDRMIPVLRFVEQNLDNDLSCSRLASVAGFERSYFTRRFTHETGISPSAYVRMKRMCAAIKLLRTNSVKRTSELLGYADEKAFARAFKATMGCTPSRVKHSVHPFCARITPQRKL